ncbi:heparan-alpha-glucosaminide N-acetyltransferase-like [Copidosoma floridanum]|uniref:heparan-alpha-glucosaminide N-acetyltransferase-like n=1 Tax=Copidosoma floridanum TaxID=29053 RepID=UPI000C6F619C|nr:heparan-alpha-glucosaminide N-acetyltransferase-like [Copidosoma floridanum]
MSSVPQESECEGGSRPRVVSVSVQLEQDGINQSARCSERGCARTRKTDRAAKAGGVSTLLVRNLLETLTRVSIPLSASSALSRGTSKLALSWDILKVYKYTPIAHSFYLFFIGVSLNTLANTQLEDIRVFGVLQRFSVAYLVAATVHTLAFRPNTATKWKRSSLADVMVMLPEWVVAFLVLAAHCLIVLRLPVPDCPNGYFGPGRLYADGKYWNCTGGATGYLDSILLGERHVYRHPMASGVYGSGAFDPESVVGCLPSIFQVFLGMHAGQILKAHRAWKGRLLRWLSWAVVYGLVAGALHYTGAIPINKNLWSLSSVMITTCFNLGLLSVFYLVIDVTGAWQGGPFRIPGINALVMYAGHQVLWSMFPFHWKIGRMNSHALLLTESIWCVGLWTLVGYVLHRKKIYFRL